MFKPDKKWQYGAIFALIAINIALIFISKNLSDKIVMFRDQLTSAQRNNGLLNHFTARYQLQLQSEDIHLVSSLMIKNELGQPASLSSLIGGGKKLVFRFSENYCQMCVDKEIQNLKTIAPKIGTKNILLFSDYKHPNGARIYRQNKQLPFNVYTLAENGLAIPIEKEETPFYFIMDSSLTAKCLFIPSTESQSLSQYYLNVIANRFFPPSDVDSL